MRREKACFAEMDNRIKAQPPTRSPALERLKIVKFLYNFFN